MMTPEEFEARLRHSPPDEFVAGVNGLDEKTRKPFLKIVKAVRKETEDIRASFFAGATIQTWEKRQQKLEQWRSRHPQVEANVVLGILACGSAADAHRLNLWQIDWQIDQDIDDLLASVLISRDPVWLKTWISKRLTGESPNIGWGLIRGLLKAGIIEKPVSEGYTELFIEAMRGYRYGEQASYVPTSERLLAEPELLEDELWRLFEFENSALTTDWQARHQDGPANYETWPEAILRLADDGHLDRDRLLDVTVSSMLLELKQNQLSAYGKLHEALAPDADEMKVREKMYLGLLVSPVGPVLSFALKMIGKLHRANRIDAVLFFDSVSPVFSHKAKNVSTQVLKITARLLAKDKALGPGAVAVAIAAMSHASPDIQAMALDLLEANLADASDAARADFERQIAFLAAKHQPRARALLGPGGEEGSQETEPPEWAALRKQVESLPADVMALVGFERPLTESMPVPLDYNVADMPGVVGQDTLAPVESQEELLELAARLIEKVELPEDVERLIDGIARHGNDRSGDFDKLAAPLAQRLKEGETSSDGLVAGGGAVSVALTDLLMSWWTGDRYDSRDGIYYFELPQEAFAARRLREVQAMLLDGESGSLLAMPSHTGGWIDPEVLVARLQEMHVAKRSARNYDLMQAILRLGPGNRAKALKVAADIPFAAASLIRFALGGDDAPTRANKKAAHLWVCAARIRNPEGSLRELLSPIAATVPKMPGLLDSTDWKWSVDITKVRSYRHAKIVLQKDSVTQVEVSNIFRRDLLQEARKKIAKASWHLWPTAALQTWPDNALYALYQYGSPWRIEWLAMQHPAETETFMSIAARMLDLRSDENTSRDTPVHAFLAALFDQTRPWGNMANLAVCLGLLSRSTDARGFAIDALIPAIESGHADCRAMGAVFAKLLDDNAYKVNRFGPAMNAVLEVSTLHRWWVGWLVDEIVERLTSPPKAMHCLYEAALDCMVQLRLTPSAAVQSRLALHKGSSKTAKLAKELLALPGASIREPGLSVIAEAWSGRLQFVSSFGDPPRSRR